ILNLFGYFFGGVVADKVNYKNLITFSLIITGISGFLFATFPSYSVMLVICVVWSISTVFTYWPAMMKAIKLLGGDDDQGKMFGFREAGFALMSLLFTSVGLAIFNNMGENFQALIIFYSIIYIVCGIATFLFLPKQKDTETKNEQSVVYGLSYVLKQPSVWLAGMVIFFAYAVGITLGKFAPYLTGVFKMSVSVAAMISIINEYAIPNIGAGGGGLLVDKAKSSMKVILYSFVIMAILLAAFVSVPGKPSLIFVAIILGMSVKLIQSALRGIYFVPVSEIGMPDKFMGTTIGVISVIGFLPDAFLQSIWGGILDTNSLEVGYKIMFSILILFCIAGFIFTLLLKKRIASKKIESAE
ncbi:MAG: MFS transporter, partial [Longicatena sp.]